MQRVVVIVAAIVLVVASLGVGVLTANWPFWRRAWAWHGADGGWPSSLPGPQVVVSGGGGVPLRFDAAEADLAAVAGGSRTQLLLRSRGGRADAWFAQGTAAGIIVDGRGLTALLLVPLFEELARVHPGLLDQPVGAWIDAWRQDQRGALTPRELLAQVGNGIATRPAFAAFNPFSDATRLASGPDFHAAALAALDPASGRGSVAPAAAAQLLAGIAAAAEGGTFAQVLERRLWAGMAAGEASLLLDRRRGEAAAHCCLRAGAPDWLRLGLRLAATSSSTGEVRVLATTGRALAIAASGAVLWVGEGDPPSGLETLLAEPRRDGPQLP